MSDIFSRIVRVQWSGLLAVCALAVLGLAGHSSRFARNIVITGNPEIPSELDLLATGDLQGWIPKSRPRSRKTSCAT